MGRQHDKQKAKAEGARMLAYEQKKAELSGSPMQVTQPPSSAAPPQHYRPQQNSGANSVKRQAPKDDALVFGHPSGDKALSAATKSCQGQEVVP